MLCCGLVLRCGKVIVWAIVKQRAMQCSGLGLNVGSVWAIVKQRALQCSALGLGVCSVWAILRCGMGPGVDTHLEVPKVDVGLQHLQCTVLGVPKVQHLCHQPPTTNHQRGHTGATNATPGATLQDNFTPQCATAPNMHTHNGQGSGRGCAEAKQRPSPQGAAGVETG
jgi:hypothetical protein